MTPLQALQSATTQAAAMLRDGLRISAASGVGKFADIDALDADPLKDIHALRTIGFRDEGRRRVQGRPDPIHGAVSLAPLEDSS